MAFPERAKGDQVVGGEFSIPVTLYHGSVTGSITSFYWASHFGTRNQALFAILAKAIRDNHSNIPYKPYLYECKHALEPGNVSKMSRDWGSPLHSAALRMYLRTLRCEEKERELWRAHDLGNPAHNARALSFLKQEMVHNNCKALSYENSIEGNALSYMILDPADIINVVETTPCKDELNEVFSKNSNKLILNRDPQLKRQLMESILSLCPSC